MKLIVLFVGCSNFFNGNISSGSSVVSSREEELATYAVTGNYILTEDEMIFSLFSFLDSKSNNTRLVTSSDNYDISLVMTDTIADNYNSARSTSINSYDDVEFYLYSIKNPSDGTEGFAITSTDRRIGNIITVIENGTINEEEVAPFMNMFLSNLDSYVEETADIWNGLTDDYLSEIAELKKLNRSTAATIVTSGNYKYSNWVYNSGNIENILYTKWKQGSPCNSVVSAETGYSTYITGCGPTALAQLCAYMEYPFSCSLDDYSDITYDWNAMKSFPYPSSLSSSAKYQVAVLMYELGVGLNVTYGTSTSCSNSNITSYLSKNDYSDSGFTDYGLSGVKSSIDNCYPVLCQGYAKKTVKEKKFLGITYSTTTSYSSGHYWIVDGYANLACTATNTTSGDTTTLTADYVHCNLGWGGSCNGYYISGVFDTNHVPVSTVSRSSGTDYYYQYKIKMLTQLHHD